MQEKKYTVQSIQTGFENFAITTDVYRIIIIHNENVYGGEWLPHKWNVRKGYLKVHVAVDITATATGTGSQCFRK